MRVKNLETNLHNSQLTTHNWSSWWPPLLILVAVFLTYSNIYSNSFLYGDDEFFILRNRYIREWRYLPKIFTTNIEAGSGSVTNFYRPIQLLHYSLIVRTFGDIPWPFHFTSVLYHAGNAILLYLLLCLLLGDSLSRQAAAVLALLWALHPIHAEDLATANGLATPSHLFWMLVSLFLFLKAELETLRPLLLRCLSFLAASLALLCKESSVIFPALLSLTHFSAIRSHRLPALPRKSIFARHAAFWTLSAGYVLLRLTLLDFGGTLNFYTQTNPFTENVSYRFYTLGTALAYGIKLLLWPAGLHPERSWPIFTSLWQPAVMVSWFAMLSLLFWGVWGWRKKPFLTAGIFWFFISYFPMSNVVAKINALFWEHWFYTPSIGLVLALGSLTRIRSWPLAIFAVPFFLGIQTFQRNFLFRNQETYSRYILRHEPRSTKHWNNLAMTLADKKLYPEAVQAYLKAIRLSDEYHQTHHNLGNAYMAVGRYDLAELEFKTALKMDPKFYPSYLALGNLYLALKNKKRAIAAFEEALRIFPELPGLRESLDGLKQ
ncbi:MAG: tetratricopeptide repeat protein [Elusimicrobia bacterium]|nr:tetratricopeptide repeat protein [Elusimicrobiota bacterium]